MLAMVMILSLGFTQGVEAKGKRAIKLSSKSITVVVGNTKKVSIKNAGKLSKKQIKAIKWSAGKNVKVKVTGKKRTTCKLIGVKKGKTTLKVKVKDKTLKCKVEVLEPQASSTVKEDNESSTESSKKDDKASSSTDKKKDNKDTKHVHKYSEWTEVEPTCTDDGYKTRKCNECGEVERVATGAKALNHLELKAVIKNPTCTEDGSCLVTCERCKKVLRTEIIPATKHDMQTKYITKATFFNVGEFYKECSKGDSKSSTYTYEQPISSLSQKTFTDQSIAVNSAGAGTFGSKHVYAYYAEYNSKVIYFPVEPVDENCTASTKKAITDGFKINSSGLTTAITYFAKVDVNKRSCGLYRANYTGVSAAHVSLKKIVEYNFEDLRNNSNYCYNNLCFKRLDPERRLNTTYVDLTALSTLLEKVTFSEESIGEINGVKITGSPLTGSDFESRLHCSSYFVKEVGINPETHAQLLLLTNRTFLLDEIEHN